MFQGYGRSATADFTLHPFYNENGYLQKWNFSTSLGIFVSIHFTYKSLLLDDIGHIQGT